MSHKKTAARFLAMAFAIVLLAISASTSFGFFFNYFHIIPPALLGETVGQLISGIIGVLLFDAATSIWLVTYLQDARTPEQRAIALILSGATFLGAAAASVAHLALSATGTMALDVDTLDTISMIALVCVILGVIANFGGSLMYSRFSYDNKIAVRESDRSDAIQAAEDAQANQLDSMIAQNVKKILTDRAPELAAMQAARIAADYERREAAKYNPNGAQNGAHKPAQPQTAVPAASGYYVQIEDEEGGWHTVNKRPFTTLAQADAEIDKYPTTRRRIVDQNGAFVLRNREVQQPARPTPVNGTQGD